MRGSKPITVTLGEQQDLLDRKLESGAYDSASDVLRAGLRALEREEQAVNALLKARILESLADPRADIPAETVFAELRALAAQQAKADESGL